MLARSNSFASAEPSFRQELARALSPMSSMMSTTDVEEAEVTQADSAPEAGIENSSSEQVVPSQKHARRKLKANMEMPEPVIYMRKNLIRTYPKPKPKSQKRTLLDGSASSSESDDDEQEVRGSTAQISDDYNNIDEGNSTATDDAVLTEFWQTKASLSLVIDFTEFPYGSIPPQLSEHMRFVPGTHGRRYYPVFAANDFWILRDAFQMIRPNTTPDRDSKATTVNAELNDKRTLRCELSLEPLALWKFLIYNQMDQSFTMQQSMGTMGENEPDNLKRILLEGNPYLLALTGCVSLLHTGVYSHTWHIDKR